MDEIEELIQLNRTILKKDSEDTISSMEPEFFIFPEVPSDIDESSKVQKKVNSPISM
jgi:hypothetical protein